MNDTPHEELELQTGEVDAQSTSKPFWWPLIAFLIATFLLDASLDPLISRFAAFNNNLTAIYITMGVVGSSLCGQWFLVMVICGLCGRTWISGYAVAAMLLLLGVFVTNLGSLLHLILSYRGEDWVIAPALFAMAAFVNGILISSGVIIAFRMFRGWRLTRQEGIVPNFAFGITDLIIGTALVALLIILGNDVRAFGLIDTTTFWEPVLMLGAFACVLGLTAVVPSVWILFRATRWRWLKLLTVISINSAIFGLIGGTILQYSEAVGETFFKMVAVGTAWGLGAFSYFVLGLLMLRVAGFRLQTGNQSATLAAVSESKVRRWVAPASVFSVLILAHLLLVAFTITKQGRDLEFRKLQREMAKRGGEISRDSRGTVRAVKLGPAATSEDLKKLVEYPDLYSISLADTAIDDQYLDELTKFEHLQSIDLSRTAITDAGLKKLAKFETLQQLSIAGTKCGVEAIAQLLSTEQLESLDLSDISLSDDGLAKIAMTNSLPRNFMLSKNRLTNAGVAALIEKQTGVSVPGVNLTDCQIDEGCLVADAYTELILDGTQISESGFGAKLQTMVVFGTLSMDRTEVTDKILPSFVSGTISKLRLGETLITEQGLSGLGPATFEGLSLNSRKFTGACFVDWQPIINSLDMSHSGVTDAHIAHIVKLPSLTELSLRDTAITDASLELLAKSHLLSLDLRDTQITAAGLAKFNWDTALKVSATQFTDDEFKFLLPLTNFKVE